MAVSAVQHGKPFAASAVQQAVPASPVSQNASRSITDDETQGITPAGNAATMPRMAVASAQTTADVALRAPRVTIAELTTVPEAISTGSTAASAPPPELSPADGASIPAEQTVTVAATLPAGLNEPSVTSQPDSVSTAVHNVSKAETVLKTAPAIEIVGAAEKDGSAATAPPPVLSPADGASVPAEKTIAVASARPNMDAYFQTSVRPAATSVADSIAPAAQTAAPLPAADAPTDVHPASVAAQHPAHGEVRPHNELMAAQEQPEVRQGSTEGAAKTEAVSGNAVVGTGKEANTTASGEKSGQSGNGFSDQRMSGQAHLVMSHQVKFDTALSETAAPATAR